MPTIALARKQDQLNDNAASELLLLGRVVWALDSGKHDAFRVGIDSLLSSLGGIPAISIHDDIKSLVTFAMQHLKLPETADPDLCSQLVTAFRLNNFGILDSADASNDVIASGIFPTAALLNHSCSPNCFKRFTAEGTLEIVAARDVPIGEELCHSYIDPLATTNERQGLLLQGYGFECACSRCNGTSPWLVLDVDSATIDFAALAEADELHRNAMLDEDPNVELSMLEQALDTHASAGVPKAHYRVQKLHYCASLTALAAGKVDRAVAHAEELVIALQSAFCSEAAQLQAHPTLQKYIEILENLKSL